MKRIMILVAHVLNESVARCVLPVYILNESMAVFVWLRRDRCVSHGSSVQSQDRPGRRGNMADDSAEIIFQSLLQKARHSRVSLHVNKT